jgi:acetyl-CoA carboxylase carboxyl transferase subunit beta
MTQPDPFLREGFGQSLKFFEAVMVLDKHRSSSWCDSDAQSILPNRHNPWNRSARIFRTWYDPLQFDDGRPYVELLKSEQLKTGLHEAAVVGQGLLKETRVVLGVVDSGFIKGSMGSVADEKLTRAIEEATVQRLPLVIVISSSGARMHEGILSLMQMAKIAAALARHYAANGFCLSLLTNPSMGGVAGFAFLADIVLAEPKAQIGFVGRMVLAKVTNIRMPDGVQTSEFALQHGFVDRIVHRCDQRDQIAQFLRYVSAR